MDINGKHSSAVQYEGFIFAPHFNRGQKNAKFHLVGKIEGLEGLRVTSPIVDIHYIGEEVYIETKNSLYQLIGNPAHLDKIEEYLKNPNLTSAEFFDKYVPNLPPTKFGWRIF